MNARIAILAIVAMLQPPEALAYRPFDATDADVAKPGESELELRVGFTWILSYRRK